MSLLASEPSRLRSEKGLARGGGSGVAKREALQPSLWDRLIDDLPGLETEIAAMRDAASADIGAEKVETLLGGNARLIDADTDLTVEQKKRLHQLVFQYRRRDELRQLGIVVSSRVLREAVRRDIEMLFNTERYESTPMMADWEVEHFVDNVQDLTDFPEVKRSVVNYGVPSFSGRSSRDFDKDALAREVRAVLTTFEPRLKEGATKVEVTLSDKTGGLKIEVDAVLVTNPTPERLRLRTTVNLENGRAQTEVRDG
ncbi:MAG: type VI secretion system baseplate subunit TssE [Rhizobiaceae bacterium]